MDSHSKVETAYGRSTGRHPVLRRQAQEDGMTYRIDSDKLAEVVRLFNKTVDSQATEELIKSEILADWNDYNHQDWLDNASAEEIVDWLASFYEGQEEQ